MLVHDDDSVNVRMDGKEVLKNGFEHAVLPPLDFSSLNGDGAIAVLTVELLFGNRIAHGVPIKPKFFADHIDLARFQHEFGLKFECHSCSLLVDDGNFVHARVLSEDVAENGF